MNLRCIAQTAALVGRFGKKWERAIGLVDELPITEYIKQSRILCRTWMMRVQANRTSPESLHNLSLFADEILASELLTRAMGAELLVLGERTRREEPSQLAFSTMSEHYKCREQLFELIDQRPQGTSTLLRCQRLARKIERWSDLLISPFTDSESAVHASFEEERSLDFGDQWYREQVSSADRGTFQVQLAALSVTIPNQEIESSLNREAHSLRNQAALFFVAKESGKPQGFQVSQLCQQISNGNGIKPDLLSSSN